MEEKDKNGDEKSEESEEKDEEKVEMEIEKERDEEKVHGRGGQERLWGERRVRGELRREGGGGNRKWKRQRIGPWERRAKNGDEEENSEKEEIEYKCDDGDVDDEKYDENKEGRKIEKVYIENRKLRGRKKT